MERVPPVIRTQPGLARVFLCAGIVALVVLVAVLFFFNPVEHGFFPRCFFRVITGWDCPGCGGLRAAHQLLHGDVRAAFALNPLLVLAFPLVVYFAARPLVERFAGLKLPQPFKSMTWLWLALAVVVSFGVLRNLPWRQWLGQ
jgi:hypothetical protein